jgi:hypothetical protein
MIRETLAANSDNVCLVANPYGGAYLQQRTNAKGNTFQDAASNPGLTPPYWVRLTRSGNLFTAFTSPDGVNWTTLGSTTVTMGANSYVGLPLTSHNGSVLGAATFGNISVSP